jgi:hypothetical protein
MLQACYRASFYLPVRKGSGKTCIFTPELRASKSIDPCAVHRPYFEAGQLEVDGTCASTGAFEMKTFFKVVIWIAAASVGLLVWNGLPDFRPLVSSILAAAFVCYVLSIIVEVTVKRVISNEQLELRSRLELLDRKVTAILRDAVEQRRLR